MNTSTEFLSELRDTVGGDSVHAETDSIVKLLRDNSWLSPVLTAHIDQRVQTEGPTLGVTAVVTPMNEQQVPQTCRLAVAHRVPITPRGAGTTNFGLVTPERGGVILDLRTLRGEPTIEDAGVRAQAGTLHGDMERVARTKGLELAILTTTYATATAAGWVVGGHVGLGSSMNGSVWDDVVRELRVVTAEDEPRVLTLTGDDVTPLLHTFGAFGIVTEVVLRTEPIRDWVEAVAFFPTFEVASKFVTELSLGTDYRHRVVTAQEETIMSAFKPLARVMQPGSGVMMIVDRLQVPAIRRLARSAKGTFVEWQDWQLGANTRPSIAAMVYGHRMLWVKQAYPDAAFLHVYFDPKTPLSGVHALKERFGSNLLVEMKYVRSRWMARQLGFDAADPVPAAVITICDGVRTGALLEVMQFCEENKIQYQNPHTAVVEDNGLIKDIPQLVAFKNKVDPYNLLNTGKFRAAGTSSK